MQIRFVTKPVHAYLIDYPVAIVLIVAPFVLKLGQGGSAAIWFSVVAGVAALMLAAMTDHPAGVFKLIPYSLHLWIDRLVGLVFLVAPFAFGFAGSDPWYYWLLGVAVFLVTSVLNASEKPLAMTGL